MRAYQRPEPEVVVAVDVLVPQGRQGSAVYLMATKQTEPTDGDGDGRLGLGGCGEHQGMPFPHAGPRRRQREQSLVVQAEQEVPTRHVPRAPVGLHPPQACADLLRDRSAGLSWLACDLVNEIELLDGQLSSSDGQDVLAQGGCPLGAVAP